MKTTLRVLALGVGISSLLLFVKWEEDKASADTSTFANAFPIVVHAAEPSPLPTAVAPAPAPPDTTTAAEATNSPAKVVAATPVAQTNATNVVLRETVAPDSIKLTPSLAEVIKLAQAGVGEDVLMAYVTNSAEMYEIGSNEILYLHDLGMPSPVIAALLQRDSSPEVQARRQLATAVKPLPPGVGLTTPATNVYPQKFISQPPEPVPVQPPVNEGAAAAPQPAPGVVPQPIVVEQPVVVEEPVTISYFQSSLAPYGSWVDVPGYGSCWRPTVAVCNSAWRPYADHGRWLWSDAGWYWYSDYSWGWAPFHYGRWACPQGIGWVWTPDTCWGPSWVSWRYTSSYCGWAPLPPSAVWAGSHGFYCNTLSVGLGFDFGLSDSHYVFVPANRFCDRAPYNYYVSSSHAHTIYKDSTVINNYVVGKNNTIVNNGVGFDRVAKVTRGDIRQVALKDGSAVRDLGPRRERLESDGKSLTVVRPTLVSSRIESPLKPISATSGLKPSGIAQPGDSIKGDVPAPGKTPRFSARQPGSPYAPAISGATAPDQPGIAPAPKIGGPGISKPASSLVGTAPLGSSYPEGSIIMKPTGSSVKSGSPRTVPSWMEGTPSSPSPSAKLPALKNSQTTVANPSPQPAAPPRSPSLARNEPAPNYTQPAAPRYPGYRSPESPQPRMNAPAHSPTPSASPRVQPTPSAPIPVTPSVAPRGESGRSYSAPSHAGGSTKPASPSSSSNSKSSDSGKYTR